jgi:hypothetical protein
MKKPHITSITSILIALALATTPQAVDALPVTPPITIQTTLVNFSTLVADLFSGNLSVERILQGFQSGSALGLDFAKLGINSTGAVPNPVDADGSIDLSETNFDPLAAEIESSPVGQILSIDNILGMIGIAKNRVAIDVAAKKQTAIDRRTASIFSDATAVSTNVAQSQAGVSAQVGTATSSLQADNVANVLKQGELDLKKADIQVNSAGVAQQQVANQLAKIDLKIKEDEAAKVNTDSQKQELAQNGLDRNTLNSNIITRTLLSW